MQFALTYSMSAGLQASIPPAASSVQAIEQSFSVGASSDRRVAYRMYWSALNANPVIAVDMYSGDDWIVLCDGRVDDRMALVARLTAGLPDEGRIVAHASPSRLILESFLKWGTRCIEEVLGDYAFVIFHRISGVIHCGTSPFGMRSLYLRQCADYFHVATEMSCLLPARPTFSDIDELAVASFLLLGHHEAMDHERTPYKYVRRLRPGGFYTIAGRRLSRDFLWAFPEQSIPLRLPSLEDYGHHFRHVLSSAIADRVGARRVAVQLSGGLDSTAVARLCHELTADGRGPIAVSAFTQIADTDDDESSFAASVAADLGFPHFIENLGASTPLGPIARTTVPIFDLFPEASARVFRQISESADVVIGGNAADNLMVPGSPDILTTFRNFGVKIAVQAAVLQYRQSGKRPSLGTGFMRVMRAGSLAPVANGARSRPPLPAWLSPEFIKLARLDEYWSDFYADVNKLPTSGFEHLRSSMMWPPWSPRIDSADNSLILPDMVDPFLDRRLIEARMSYPEMGLMQKKHVLRIAMRGRLPEAILSRPKRPGRNLFRSQIDKLGVRESLDLNRETAIGEFVCRERYAESAAQCDRLDLTAWVLPLLVDRWLAGLNLPVG